MEPIENGVRTLDVRLMEYSQNAIPLIYSIAKQCNSTDAAADIYLDAKLKYNGELYQPTNPEISNVIKQRNLIQKVIASGHTSVVEHINFTFGIAGFSRISSQQVTRHRIGMAVTQQSQRETSGENFTFIIPPHILFHDDTRQLFFEKMSSDRDYYIRMHDMLVAHGYMKQSCQEDARFFLPNATETKFVLTFNARALLHFIELRNCHKAQWEVRALGNSFLKQVNEVVPTIFESAGPPCERFGFCMEHKSCGRYPSITTLLEKINN